MAAFSLDNAFSPRARELPKSCADRPDFNAIAEALEVLCLKHYDDAGPVPLHYGRSAKIKGTQLCSGVAVAVAVGDTVGVAVAVAVGDAVAVAVGEAVGVAVGCGG